MSKIKLFIYLLILLILTTGCGKKPLDNDSSITLDIRKTAKVFNGKRILHAPDIMGIIGADDRDGLIGFLTFSGEKVLYLINPNNRSAKQLSVAENGKNISSAVMEKNHLIWVEKDLVSWNILHKDLSSGEVTILDKGTFFTEGGMDYPYLSLSENDLVYNISEQGENGELISKIIYINLNNRSKDVIGYLKGKNTYLGAPSIYNKNVVWHRGEWGNELNAEIYLYNLERKDRKTITSEFNAAITPVIWENYIAYNTYNTENPEVKNIEIRDIQTNKTHKLTNNETDSRLESWGPTIDDGKVAWKTNHPTTNITVYLTDKSSFEIIDSPTYHTSIYGSWIVWLSVNTQKQGFYLCRADGVKQ